MRIAGILDMLRKRVIDRLKQCSMCIRSSVVLGYCALALVIHLGQLVGGHFAVPVQTGHTIGLALGIS